MQSMIDAHFGLLRCGNCNHQFNINDNKRADETNRSREPQFSERMVQTEEPNDLSDSKNGRSDVMPENASLKGIALNADDVLKAHVRHLKALDSEDMPKDYSVDEIDVEGKVEPRLFVNEPREHSLEAETIEDSLTLDRRQKRDDDLFNFSEDENKVKQELSVKLDNTKLTEKTPRERTEPAMVQRDQDQDALKARKNKGIEVNQATIAEERRSPGKGEPAPEISADNEMESDALLPPDDYPVITPLQDDELTEETRPVRSGKWVRLVLWPITTVILLGLLAYQIKTYYVPAYQHDPIARPFVVQFCKLAGCEVELKRDINQLEVVVSRLDRVSEESNDLKVSLYILNRGDFVQPYPDITLTLNDRAAQAVGRRTFTAASYLDTGVSNRLEPDKLGGISLEISDPPEGALGFEVVLINP